MELYIIPITNEASEDKFIIYRPLRQLAFVGNQAMADLAQSIARTGTKSRLNGEGKAAAFLNNIGFIDPTPSLPCHTSTEFQPTTAVLLMTNQCQLRCTYCYAAAGTLPQAQLTVEQGRAAIDYVCQSALEQGSPYFELSLHGGGEPTFAWQTLKECVTYARQKPLPAQIGITSNGIWSPAQREWILSNLDNATISLDGSPQTQNKNRPVISGKGSSRLVMQTIADLDQHEFQYGIRMTVTAPWDQLPTNVEYICKETKCPVIQAEPAFKTTPRGHVHGSAEDYRAFARAFIAAFEIASAAGRHMFYSGARLGLVTNTFCLAPYNALIITPHGQLVTCYEITDDLHPLASVSTIGEYKDKKFKIDKVTRAHLHTLMNERHEVCESCFCFHSCAGDCYTRAWSDQENGHLQHSLRCQLNRDLTKNLLLNAILDGDGIWDGMKQSRPVSVAAPMVDTTS